MGLLFNITWVLLIISFPLLYWWKKATIDFSIRVGFMLGFGIDRKRLVFNDTLFDHYRSEFCFGPLIVTGEWFEKIGTADTNNYSNA